MTIWRSVKHPDLRMLDLDSCVMVLNPWTWETHYLTAFIGAVFLAVSEGPRDAREITNMLSADASDFLALSQAVEAALKELASFGLVGTT
jgi:PqqD family protein of HPr-rel-A system